MAFTDWFPATALPKAASKSKGLKDFLFGTSDKIKKAGLLSPLQEQMLDLIKQGLTEGEGPLSDIFGGFNREAFEEGITKPALQNFKENILPQIQEKFIAGNQVLGSGMRRGQLKAGQDLQTMLSQLMYEAQQEQAKNRITGIQSILGTQPFENIYKQGKTGAVQGFLQGVGQGAGQAAGAAVAG